MDKARNVQYASVAVAEINYDDYTSGTGEVVVSLPAGAYVTGGHINVVTAWDSATSSVGDLGDSADDDEYTSTQINMKTAAMTALTLTGVQYADGEDLTLTITDVGAPSAGKAIISVEYLVPGRGHEVSY